MKQTLMKNEFKVSISNDGFALCVDCLNLKNILSFFNLNSAKNLILKKDLKTL